MESIYEKPITLREELRMKYEAVKRFEKIGYSAMKRGEDILIFDGKNSIGRLAYDEVENVPIAVIEEQNFNNSDSMSILVEGQSRRAFKQILLDLDWAVS